MWVYRCSNFLFIRFFSWFHKFQSIGWENVPAGGVILTPNHASYFDPLLVGIALPTRHVTHVAKRELSRSRFLRWYMPRCGVLLIRRGGVNRDLEKTILQLLDDGGCVCLFPEGTRTRTGELGGGKPGVGRLVLRAGKPVVPMHMEGTYEAWHPGGGWHLAPINVRFGTPLEFSHQDRPAKADCQATADRIMKGIAELVPGKNND